MQFHVGREMPRREGSGQCQANKENDLACCYYSSINRTRRGEARPNGRGERTFTMFLNLLFYFVFLLNFSCYLLSARKWDKLWKGEGEGGAGHRAMEAGGLGGLGQRLCRPRAPSGDSWRQ